MADKATLKKNIAEILEDADLNTITAKKVRQQLETKLGTDLADRKKEIDDMVMKILEEKQNDAGSDDEEVEEEEKPVKSRSKRKAKDSDDEEEEVAPKKTRGGKKSGDSDEEYGKKKKPAAKGKKGGTGYTKLCTLSPELAAVMGETSMARHEVVKKMWQIVKEKNLYDPKNKQFAICNEELLKVFGVKRFRTFGMMKYLKTHFTD